MNIKEWIFAVLADLTEDATIEDAIYRVHLLAKIDHSLAQGTTGDTLSQDDIRRRLAPFFATASKSENP